MSFPAVRWALDDAPVPAHLLGTLIAVARHTDVDGRGARASIDRYAYYARKSARTVQRDLRSLEGLGLIRAGNQALTAHLRGDKRTRVYDVAMERAREAEPWASYPGDVDVTPPVDNQPTECHLGPGGVTLVAERGDVDVTQIDPEENKEEIPPQRVCTSEALTEGGGEIIIDTTTTNPTPVTVNPQTDPVDEIVAAVLAMPRTHLSPSERAAWTPTRVRAALTDPVVLDMAGAVGADLAAAALACYSDPRTRFPGRLRGSGPWWDRAVPATPRMPVRRLERGVALPPERLGEHLALARALIARRVGEDTP